MFRVRSSDSSYRFKLDRTNPLIRAIVCARAALQDGFGLQQGPARGCSDDPIQQSIDRSGQIEVGGAHQTTRSMARSLARSSPSTPAQAGREIAIRSRFEVPRSAISVKVGRGSPAIQTVTNRSIHRCRSKKEGRRACPKCAGEKIARATTSTPLRP